MVYGPTRRCPYGESGGKPYVTSPSGYYIGLFQEGQEHAAEFGFAIDQLFDPVVNTYVAWRLYERDGWSWQEWSCRPY